MSTDVNGVTDGSLIDAMARWLHERHPYPVPPPLVSQDPERKRIYKRRYVASHRDEINARRRAAYRAREQRLRAKVEDGQ